MLVLLQALYLASAERYCRHGSYKRIDGRTAPTGDLITVHTLLSERWTEYKSDIDTCAFECRTTNECVAYAYNRKTKLCTHLDEKSEREHYVIDEDGEGDYVYGDDDDLCMENPLRKHGKSEGEVCEAAYEHPRYGQINFTGLVDKFGTCVEFRTRIRFPRPL